MGKDHSLKSQESKLHNDVFSSLEENEQSSPTGQRSQAHSQELKPKDQSQFSQAQQMTHKSNEISGHISGSNIDECSKANDKIKQQITNDAEQDDGLNTLVMHRSIQRNIQMEAVFKNNKISITVVESEFGQVQPHQQISRIFSSISNGNEETTHNNSKAGNSNNVNVYFKRLSNQDLDGYMKGIFYDVNSLFMHLKLTRQIEFNTIKSTKKIVLLTEDASQQQKLENKQYAINFYVNQVLPGDRLVKRLCEIKMNKIDLSPEAAEKIKLNKWKNLQKTVNNLNTELNTIQRRLELAIQDLQRYKNQNEILKKSIKKLRDSLEHGNAKYKQLEQQLKQNEKQKNERESKKMESQKTKNRQKNKNLRSGKQNESKNPLNQQIASQKDNEQSVRNKKVDQSEKQVKLQPEYLNNEPDYKDKHAIKKNKLKQKNQLKNKIIIIEDSSSQQVSKQQIKPVGQKLNEQNKDSLEEFIRRKSNEEPIPKAHNYFQKYPARKETSLDCNKTMENKKSEQKQTESANQQKKSSSVQKMVGRQKQCKKIYIGGDSYLKIGKQIQLINTPCITLTLHFQVSMFLFRKQLPSNEGYLSQFMQKASTFGPNLSSSTQQHISVIQCTFSVIQYVNTIQLSSMQVCHNPVQFLAQALKNNKYVTNYLKQLRIEHNHSVTAYSRQFDTLIEVININLLMIEKVTVIHVKNKKCCSNNAHWTSYLRRGIQVSILGVYCNR